MPSSDKDSDELAQRMLGAAPTRPALGRGLRGVAKGAIRGSQPMLSDYARQRRRNTYSRGNDATWPRATLDWVDRPKSNADLSRQT